MLTRPGCMIWAVTTGSGPGIHGVHAMKVTSEPGNRSMPPGTIIPELAYADVRVATLWLCRAFGFGHAVMVRLDDVDAHCERARLHGARIVPRPTDFPYGERQYSAVDIGGHAWTFSQTIADVDPTSWGGSFPS
jgi:hypothetical protein